MAMPVELYRIGVDVAKDELVIAEQGAHTLIELANTPEAIGEYLARLEGRIAFAVEATSTYHLELVAQAHRRGLQVYLIDGYRLSRYREGVGGRAKTDEADARLLLRYLEREGEDLRPWQPPSQGYTQLQRLLRRRARLVQVKVTLSQSLKALPELRASARAVLRTLERLDQLIQKRLVQTLNEQGWREDAQRVQQLEGVGVIVAAALTMVFYRGEFRSSDAYIAFMGLDVRVRDSGRLRGRRKLTKRGNPELRRLLYLAAMQASRSATWAPFYQRHLARGLSRIQALVALARKLARVAFALLKHKSDYQPKIA